LTTHHPLYRRLEEEPADSPPTLPGGRGPAERSRLALGLLAFVVLVGSAVAGWAATRGDERPAAMSSLFGGVWDGWWASQADISVGQPFLLAQDLYIPGRRYRGYRVRVAGMRFASWPRKHTREVAEIDIYGISVWTATTESLRRERGEALERVLHPTGRLSRVVGWRWSALRGYSARQPTSSQYIGFSMGSAAGVFAASRKGLYVFAYPTIWGTIRSPNGATRRWRQRFDMHYVACVGFGYSRCVSMIDRLYQKNGV